MLKNVPGIGCILIGEGDLSQELGYPRQYEHKTVLEWMKRIVDTCKKHNVVVGHPHVESGNVERIVKEGYRFLMCAPVQSLRAPDSGAEGNREVVAPLPGAPVASHGRPQGPPLCCVQAALLFDKSCYLVDALADAQVGEDEWPFAAHAF